MVENLLDLSMAKSSDEVRQAAEAHWNANHPVPEEPTRPALYRPAVMSTTDKGRVWFELVFDRNAYNSDSGAEFHLRSHQLQPDERLSFVELVALQGELRNALAAFSALDEYGEARKVWKKALEKHKEDLRLYLDATLKTWADLQKEGQKKK